MLIKTKQTETPCYASGPIVFVARGPIDFLDLGGVEMCRLLDVDLASGGCRCLRNDDAQDAILEASTDIVLVDARREGKRA